VLEAYRFEHALKRTLRVEVLVPAKPLLLQLQLHGDGRCFRLFDSRYMRNLLVSPTD
jgi:hypothetical protein